MSSGFYTAGMILRSLAVGVMVTALALWKEWPVDDLAFAIALGASVTAVWSGWESDWFG